MLKSDLILEAIHVKQDKQRDFTYPLKQEPYNNMPLYTNYITFFCMLITIRY